jgi:hypothetical protein
MFLDASLREVQSWEIAAAAERRPVVTRTIRKRNFFILLPSTTRLLEVCRKSRFSKASQKCSNARRPKSRRVRRTFVYAATMKDKGNAAGGRF